MQRPAPSQSLAQRASIRARLAGSLLGGLLTLAGHSPAHAIQSALLVGVSGYPTLEAAYRLEGPRNDVRRLRDVLTQRGFAPTRITLLADGVLGAQDPTRANILQALAAQAEAAQAGDTVLLYFAGHGSQQPADRSTPEGKQEADGLFEIFLPIDVGRWDGRTGTVKNAIIDHELRAAVDRVLARGAFVWGVFDACHSASMVRSAPASEVRWRHVSPTDLGIAPQALDAAADAAPRSRGTSTAPPPSALIDEGALGRPRAGQAVFFYAAQTTEVTPEMRLPQGDPERQTYGLFSFMLTRALAMAQPMSYRQLSQYILAQYGAINEARVTPVFAGSALDQAVLGQQTLPVRQWPVTPSQLVLPEGRLSDLAPEALLALLPGPLARDDEAIGYLQATQVQLTRTELTPVAHAGKAAPQPETIPPGSYARLVSNPQRFSLRIGLDTTRCTGACPWLGIINTLKARGVPGADLQWSDAADTDLLLQLTPDSVWALSPSERGAIDCRQASDCPRGTRLLTSRTADPVSTLSQALHAIARATNLMRLATQLAGQARGQGLAVRLEVGRAAGGPRLTIAAEQVPALQPGDKLTVTLRNEGPRPIDVTLLYADARHGIGALFPTGQGEVNRLEPGATQVIDDLTVSDAEGVFGLERLLVIAVEAQKHGERADFSYLAQPSLGDATRSRGGSTPSNDVQAFMDAAFADYRTRGQPARSPGKGTGMQVFTVNVRPAGATP